MKEAGFRTIVANFVIVFSLIFTFAVVITSVNPQGQEQTQTVNNALYCGDKNSNSVALMFNVYQNTAEVQKICDTLLQYKAKATFFLGGSWVAKNLSTVRYISACGFEIGNHGYLHKDHAKMSLEQNLKEIDLAKRQIDVALEGMQNTASMLFAPPSGSMGENMFAACDKLGYKVIMWSRDTIDWRDQDENVIFERAIKDIGGGDLILMHPTPCTLAALPKILQYISDKGLVADTVSQTLR